MRSPHNLLLFSVAVLGLGVRCEAAPQGSASDVQPKVETLPRQHYIAVRRKVSMEQLGKVIPKSIGNVAGWLGAHGAQPAGPPFVRYLVVDMPKHLEIEIGFPVAGSIKADGPVIAGDFPAGRYVTFTYTGSYDGLVGANGAVQDWAQKKGLLFDRKPSKQGIAWGARAEYYLTDPSHEPNPKKYKTKIVFRLAK